MMMMTMMMAFSACASSTGQLTASAHQRCAAAIVSRQPSWDRATIESRCNDPETWQIVRNWEETRGVRLTVSTVAPIVLEYYRAEADFLDRNPEKAEQIRAAGKQALNEYMTDIITKKELPTMSSIIGRILGFGGFVFPRENPYALLRVVATPVDSDVYIDAERFSHSIREYAVPVGEHDVVVRKVTYRDCSKHITLKKNDKRDVICSLAH